MHCSQINSTSAGLENAPTWNIILAVSVDWEQQCTASQHKRYLFPVTKSQIDVEFVALHYKQK